MSAESNRAAYVRFYEGAMNRKDYGVIDEVVAADVVSHDPFPGQKPGAEGLRETLQMFHRAFPDLHAQAEAIVADDDMVAARFRVSGTHQGEFMGQKATGKRVDYAEAVFVRFADGKIVEHWAVADAMALMQGIGAA
jgi:steroid delta-isomerase-like uncharacterized protein